MHRHVESIETKNSLLLIYLKGMCGLLVASADMTSPSADRDLLIF